MLEACPVNHNILGKLDVSVKKCEDGFGRYVIELKNRLNKILGKETISIEDYDNAMVGYYISVEPEYQKRGFRLGELLRLFSVMEMHKNKCSSIKIFSKDTAIYFHSKFKFVPNNKSFKTRDMMLNTMAENKNTKFSEISLMAKSLKDEVDKTIDIPDLQRALCVDTNELATEYITKAIATEQKPETSYSFPRGMDMILTKENLYKNREFYNSLFDKHGIDYSV